jgi:hypothetical protein
MSTIKLVGAVAILSIAIATPALAQQVISEPGYCAFFYPNANCQNKGPGNPYTDPNYQRGAINRGTVYNDRVYNDRVWSSGETVGVAPKRSRTHRSGSPAMRMQ